MKQYKILNHTEKYCASGIIDDSIVPYFDQNGHWIGDKVGWECSTYVTALNLMKRAYLPFGRRIVLHPIYGVP
jgi:hypothetical protein